MRALYHGVFPPSPGFTLYSHLLRSALFPFGNSVNLCVWLSCKESILSCMALNYLRLWVSFLASSKLSNSPSLVNNTCSSSGNLWEGFLSLRGYLLPWFSTTGSSVGSSFEFDLGSCSVSVYSPSVDSVSCLNPVGPFVLRLVSGFQSDGTFFRPADLYRSTHRMLLSSLFPNRR